MMNNNKPILVDAHEDLAWNMLTFGRDYTRTVPQTRTLEANTAVPQQIGHTLLGIDAYRRARAAVVFATLFAGPIRRQEHAWDTLSYRDDEEAHSLYSQQLDAYHRLCDTHPDDFRLITSRTQLQAHLAQWENPAPGEALPIGLVVLMEGAEGVRHVEELPEWWERGVRLIGPAWAGTRFCGGTREPGPLTTEGHELLEAMGDQGFVLDLSHMDEQAAFQALERYEGTVIASHANPLAMLPGIESNRFLSDQLLETAFERDVVVGVVPYNLFLDPNWVKGMRKELVTIDKVAAHIDYICQRAGDALHAGFGSDFDGGFSVAHVPAEIDTLADLHKIAPLLAEKGYQPADIEAIFGKNWLNMLQSALPE